MKLPWAPLGSPLVPMGHSRAQEKIILKGPYGRCSRPSDNDSNNLPLSGIANSIPYNTRTELRYGNNHTKHVLKLARILYHRIKDGQNSTKHSSNIHRKSIKSKPGGGLGGFWLSSASWRRLGWPLSDFGGEDVPNLSFKMGPSKSPNRTKLMSKSINVLRAF